MSQGNFNVCDDGQCRTRTVYTVLHEIPYHSTVVVSTHRTIAGARISVDKETAEVGGRWVDSYTKRFDSQSDWYWICESELEE